MMAYVQYSFCIISNFVLSHFHDTCVFLVPGASIKGLIFGPGPSPTTVADPVSAKPEVRLSTNFS